MPTTTAAAAILLCAGSGSRMQGRVEDKILEPILGLPTVCYSVAAFAASRVVRLCAMVTRDPQQHEGISAALSLIETPEMEFVWASGGTERQDSVWNGLTALPNDITHVLIHDCARPLVSASSIRRVHSATVAHRAAVLAHRVTDTIKRAEGSARSLHNQNLIDIPRTDLWAMETPQAFERTLITEAYRKVLRDNIHITDDTAAAQINGHLVTVVENTDPNPKITRPTDLDLVAFLLQQQSS